MVGVTSQVQQVAGSSRRSQQRSDQAGSATRQEQDAGPRKNTHQGRVCRSGHLLNTPV
ncbi:unnamed protein product [Staurois parvus]|uniref:Uncharacterized protein n=1 Tax=Staurois parvus TaxID=386267 RepID=A0ABN9HD98_9NEOB|nr:unnamed protein product [Staurois parvus]